MSATAAVSPGRQATVAALQARIAAMQATTLGVRTLPTSPVIAPLLPGGALRAGGVYAVPDSLLLAMLLLAGPSQAGAWCAVVGIPDFGVEAAAGLGVDLSRLILVPAPGGHWLTVCAQLAEVLPVVLVRPPGPGASPGETERIASRLRQRGGVLLVDGRWGGAEAVLRPDGGHWTGIEAGAGLLDGRVIEVEVTARDVTTRHLVPVGAATAPAVSRPRAVALRR